ncbi:hypothetical protein FA10DRAFT_263402 [Acaromyces ingoldii]|uniref:Uncharacterized protein n=1 Tax=Acaromyces ingoldii TaxID=215250 RepID=A0A316YU55_9BASI|nr:hypothetical protein FA10DRAFT_263402 [Acaromyces ingoldii]PWN92632.1 hypothetical protein FA10DRAFT_263402 [Acaromyces ingoldii]
MPQRQWISCREIALHSTRTRAGVSAAAAEEDSPLVSRLLSPRTDASSLLRHGVSPSPTSPGLQSSADRDERRQPAFVSRLSRSSRSRDCPPNLPACLSLSSSRLALVTAHLAYVSLSLCLYESRSRLRSSLVRISLAPRHSASLGAIWRASFPAGIRDTTFVFLKRLRLFFSSSKGDTIWRRGTTAPIDG